MFEEMRDAIQALSSAVDGIDESRLTGASAAQLVTLCASAERKLAAARLMATRRVDETKAWQREGHRSAAAWVAATTGTFIKNAIDAVETARRLDDLPLVAGEFRSGRLSEEQVRHIADAAHDSPEHERSLIACAQSQTVKTLREDCRKVKDATDDERARLRRLHERRYARTWLEADGCVRLDARFAPEAGVQVLAAVDAAKDRIFRSARRAGRREPHSAYMADAVAELIIAGTGGGSAGPKALVKVVVDHDVLVSGVATATSTCHVPGVGPIPAATAQALAQDAILHVLVRKGGDVVAVTSAERTIPKRLREALEVRDPTCVVVGCDEDRRLEIDHVNPMANHGRTELKNLARLCHHHHFLKTCCGYRLTGGPGGWRWVTPSDLEGARPPPDG